MRPPGSGGRKPALSLTKRIPVSVSLPVLSGFFTSLRSVQNDKLARAELPWGWKKASRDLTSKEEIPINLPFGR